MANPMTPTTEATRRFRQLLAFALLCAALVAAIAIPTAGAVGAKVIGKTKNTPMPACPRDCSVIGKVTGFMTKADGERQLFKVDKSGKIVAWAINLSKVRNTEKHPDRKFFGNLFENKKFGKHPSARLSILRKKKRKNYKLVKQSPALDLRRYMGRKQIFTLNKPLRVRRGQIVALTYPTWAPNFADPVSARRNHWRASRNRGKCNTDRDHIENVEDSRPHQKVGTVRRYECRYEGARLLYWAYFVPNKKK